ncbi:MAG: hypothetical protein ABFE02_00525 [Sulfuricella sp.]
MPTPHPQDAAPSLPETKQLLVAGGDARIALDPDGGTNRYGCTPFPDPELAAFGSSTATAISAAGFAAADGLRNRVLSTAARETLDIVCEHEFERIRQELTRLCGIADLPGLEAVFASSGTDLHSLAGQLAGAAQDRPTLAIMVETAETGSGVASSLAAGGRLEITSVPIRHADGTPRPVAEIDTEVETLAAAAGARGQHVLLILVDVSKTGLIAPSPACVAKLHARRPESIDVLVDACQFRIANSTLRAYLEQGFMVGLTGSKFIAGPTFSGVLLIPAAAAPHLRDDIRRPGLPCVAGRANLGLLLRWEAALTELRAFRALPENAVHDFLLDFAQAVRNRLTSDPLFELLPTLPLDRRPLAAAMSWDAIPTIFPFLLHRNDSQSGRKPLNAEETTRISRLLQLDLSGEGYFSSRETAALRCQLGQPVACGMRDGVPVSALRLCVSARLVVEAMENDGAAAVIGRAMTALDKTAQLVMRLTKD